ncbi:UNKNOWN [Stylonychia lemnae]|uniref:Uncharacterized protein n=1 Tax=Stylonychia lemnae TaxID=5949 RepID=A0A078AFU4_STYLE|nr:UNKNOWN [Stylonychia lemnae]|eukprot:CDW80706.1 UNKNOWN [Stylonychia lemnae]
MLRNLLCLSVGVVIAVYLSIYTIQTVTDRINIKKVDFINTDFSKDELNFFISKDVKFRFDVSFQSPPDNNSIYRIQYEANNAYFTGRDFDKFRYKSPQLDFSYRYKVLIRPIWEKNQENLFAIGEDYVNYVWFYTEPPQDRYPVQNIPDGESSSKYVTIEFGFSERYQPEKIYTIIPDTYYLGLSKIGGYLTILGLFRILLLYINQKLYMKALYEEFIKILNKEFRQQNQVQLDVTRHEFQELFKRSVTMEGFMELILQKYADQYTDNIELRDQSHNISQDRELPRNNNSILLNTNLIGNKRALNQGQIRTNASHADEESKSNQIEIEEVDVVSNLLNFQQLHRDNHIQTLDNRESTYQGEIRRLNNDETYTFFRD